MDMKIFKINENGVEMIRQFLLQNHKRPQEETSAGGMARWLMDAGICADVMEGVVILEIPAQDSVSGEAVAYQLDESGIDVETINEI